MSLDDLRKQVIETIRSRVPFHLASFGKLDFPAWRNSRTMRLVTLSVTLGIIGALAAGLFVGMIHLAEEMLLGGIAGYHPPNLPGEGSTEARVGAWGLWPIPLVTTLGGLVSGMLVYWLAPHTGQAGTDAVIRSFHQQGGSMPVRTPLIKAVASALTIGSGGSVGREGPMAQIGAALGNMLAKPLKLSVPDRRILVLAGVAAGISATFKAPLGAALLAVEVLYSGVDFEVDALMFTIISASVGYAVAGLFTSWEPLFNIPPELALQAPSELIWYALLGVVAGGLALLVPHSLCFTEKALGKLELPEMLRPALGGLLLGLLALAIPQVLGGGYGWIDKALNGHLGLGLMAALVLAKMVATSLTVGSGGSGGVFAPSLYIGAMMGTSLATLLHTIAPELTATVDVSAMAIVGMAALFAGVARAPVAMLVMGAEMTGGYGLLVPTMIATVTAFLIVRSVDARFNLPHPLLYRSQVDSRLHSPTHQSEYIQNVLHVMDDAEIELEHQSMSWHELELHLRQGDPIPMGPEGEFLFSAHVSQESCFAGERIRDLPLVSDEVLIASIMREGHHLTPRGKTVIEPGDLLLIISNSDEIPELEKYVDVVRYEAPAEEQSDDRAETDEEATDDEKAGSPDGDESAAGGR